MTSLQLPTCTSEYFIFYYYHAAAHHELSSYKIYTPTLSSGRSLQVVLNTTTRYNKY